MDSSCLGVKYRHLHVAYYTLIPQKATLFHLSPPFDAVLAHIEPGCGSSASLSAHRKWQQYKPKGGFLSGIQCSGHALEVPDGIFIDCFRVRAPQQPSSR